MTTWQEYDKNNRPMRYVRVECMTCHGTGETHKEFIYWIFRLVFILRCSKCRGKGYQYVREDHYLEDINSITQG